MEPDNVAAWGADWAWALPLIVGTVVFHAWSLGFVNECAIPRLKRLNRSRHSASTSMFVIGGTALSATVLHAIEVFTWAVTYRLLGASPNSKSAMLYSMNAMTAYGHVNLYLEPRWQMMGALEALDGWILFGLTTAFIFTVIHRVWLHTRQEE